MNKWEKQLGDWTQRVEDVSGATFNTSFALCRQSDGDNAGKLK